MLVQKKQVRPIKLKDVKLEETSDIDWQDLDELARSTIMLTLSKSVYFNPTSMSRMQRRVLRCGQKLCDL